MLRLPAFELVEPTTVDEVLALLEEHEGDAMLIAGGTDLLPNMKHGLFEPKLVVSLMQVQELVGVRDDGAGGLAIGAMTTIADVASNPLVNERAPALAQATSLIAGPQLRTMGTLGGNVMLDTRCQWYNQTYFWREALGFCLKKDGTACHVVEGGQKCVAAASNDSAPALMSLGARLTFRSRSEERDVGIGELWKPDGIWNKKAAANEVLTEIRVPAQAAGHRGAYGKLRDRGSIDFPLFGVAVRLDLDGDTVRASDICAIALAARPLRLTKAIKELDGSSTAGPAWADTVERAAQAAYAQCHPLANIPGDHDYRREMVPVYVRRTLQAALAESGPVHHI